MTVADLVVNVLANTGQINPALDELRNKLHQTLEEPKNPIEELAHGLHGIEGQLKGFNALLGLGLGAHIGRHLFAELHEELSKFGEAFGEATSAGEGFFEAIGDGAKHMLGFKTQLEELHEHLQEIQKDTKELSELTDITEKLDHLGNPKADKRLPGEIEADRLLDEAQKKAQAAIAEAAPGKTQLAVLQQRRDEENASGTQNLFGTLIRGGSWDELIKKQEKENSLKDYFAEQAEEELKRAREATDKAKKQAHRDQEADEQKKLLHQAEEAATKLLHEAQQKLAHEMQQRAEQLKHDTDAAQRIRAQDDAGEKFRQEAQEAERLHRQHLLTDDETNTRLNKLKQDFAHSEMEERKKQGLLAPGSAGHAVEARSLEAYHDLAEFRAGGAHNPQLDETKKTNTILLDIKTHLDKEGANNAIKNFGLDLLAGVTSIL
jgi:hypothetical protein